MEQDEVQRFADSHSLDVRPVEPWHYRLMDTYGNPVLDVFFKRTKAGAISRNRVFQFSTRKWAIAYNQKDLNRLMTHKIK